MTVKNTDPVDEEFFNSFDLELLNATVCISFKNKYIYFEVAKSGSTSLKHMLHQVEKLGLPRVGNIPPHALPLSSPFVKPYQLTRQQLVEIFADRSFFKFSFVRNPYVRLLSGYLDKIVHAEPEKQLILRALGRDKPDSSTDVSFAEFVDVIAQQPPGQRNKHWRLQRVQSFAAFCKLDFVGRLETFEKDVAHLSNELRVNLSAVKFAPHRTGAEARLEEFYTDEIAAKVFKIYQADFTTFRYARALPKAPRAAQRSRAQGSGKKTLPPRALPGSDGGERGIYLVDALRQSGFEVDAEPGLFEFRENDIFLHAPPRGRTLIRGAELAEAGAAIRYSVTLSEKGAGSVLFRLRVADHAQAMQRETTIAPGETRDIEVPIDQLAGAISVELSTELGDGVGSNAFAWAVFGSPRILYAAAPAEPVGGSPQVAPQRETVA